ncbi:Hydroxymethylglutaryl-CoA reductase [Streptococcus sp. DD10]|uniref:hydroxymethylglutaryl-CoA reductase, degradative n=1 Tax=Streptococcus sp. DD10 TaxID=1777878 RepID=UPI00079A985B|nr:hydroxymethylglutaryl-CoA reductase, degradative [Streptococcus sp. DD10]KXT74785.1 Hydroxymethylglutaryl-CoA reductase [Streptococcus sp. DD10]
MNRNWSGFSKKNPQERLHILKENNLVSEDIWKILQENSGLPLSTADQMVENLIGTFSLPYSLAPNFLIDGMDYTLPLVTEEPSVVAAASFAAKIIKRSGGFLTTVHKREMIGQVALYHVKDISLAKEKVLSNKELLLYLANQAYPSIVKRGGGARELWIEEKAGFLICYLSVDTKEAMGANMLNTMLEALTYKLEELTDGKSLMAILSNYASNSLVTSQCHIDFRYLSRHKEEADKLALKIELASQLAQADPYRAATHNKGIFNGIDALVIATGNDWRAIEAGCHAYACKDGAYRGLSLWKADFNKRILHGQLTLPMPIATKGGSIGLNPTAQASHELLGNPDAKKLATIIVSLGLAQNFAALKALISTGIQAGHMKLQAKSLALLAGAKEDEMPLLVAALLNDQPFNQEKAQAILTNLRQQKND